MGYFPQRQAWVHPDPARASRYVTRGYHIQRDAGVSRAGMTRRRHIAPEPLPRGRTWMAMEQAAVPVTVPLALFPRGRRHRRRSPEGWTPARSRLRRWTPTPTACPRCDYNAAFTRRPNGHTQAISNVQPVPQARPAQDRTRITRTILPLVSQPALAPGEGTRPGTEAQPSVPPTSGRPAFVFPRLREAGHRGRRPQESDR